ncbi:MAG: sulfatase-like hydrolase/transferase, partial [Verrucomicrobiota bacterium]
MRPLRFLPRFTFTFISAVALALAVAHAAQPATPPRPNLIVIMADDIGASELSGYGHTTHRTPNLDQLGQTGVQFDTCYTAPVCHPTRFTLMTGQYGFRTGVVNFSGKRGGPPKKHQGPDNITTHLTFA